MKMGCFPLGNMTRPYKDPSDTLTKEVAKLMTTPSEIRGFFQEGIYMTPSGSDAVHQISDLIRAVPICVEADQIASKLRKEKRQPTTEEAEKIAKADALRDVLVQVDVFEHLTTEEGMDGYVRPALVGTEERLAHLERKRFVEDGHGQAA
jgi:Domain of unknown function (DUF1974).